MAKEEPQPMYPCMTPPGDLRRVHDPKDEHRAAVQSGRVRRALAKLRGARVRVS